jgi:proteasome accessory factor C
MTASLRMARLLSLVPWVADHNGAPVAEVCSRFEITEGQLLSDIELVSMTGVPPYHGGELFEMTVEDGRVWVHLSPSFDRPLRLTPEQGLALVAAGAGLLAVPGADPDGSLARGLRKLAATLGVEPDEMIDVRLGPVAGDVLAVVRQAIDEHRGLHIDYYTYGRDERAERDVDPYRLFVRSGDWYVVAHCHRVGAEKVFRADRIMSASLLDTTFEPPPEPPTGDLFEASAEAARVTLDLPAASRWVAETYPVESVEEHGDGEGAGRLRVTLAVGSRPWLERLLLRVGPEGSVVAGPPDLMDAGATAARRILARYR